MSHQEVTEQALVSRNDNTLRIYNGIGPDKGEQACLV